MSDDIPVPPDERERPRRRIDPDDIFRPEVVTARYAHPARYPLLARAALTPTARDELAERVLAIAPGLRRELEDSFRIAVHTSVDELLADPVFAADVAALPFRVGDRIVALGDSITDDACSWAEMLRRVLEVTETEVTVINAGIAGNVTAEAIARIDLVAACEPTWVIQLFGTNDVRRHGSAGVRLVSQDETLRNIDGLGQLVTGDMGARLVRMILPPTRAAAAADWPDFQKQGIAWRDEDVAELADILRAADPNAVDLHTSLTASLDRWLLPDGVHPTVAGQQQILRTLVRQLARNDGDTASSPSPGDG